MKTLLRNYAASAFLLLPGLGALVALPATAVAQPALPAVQTLEVDGDGGLDAGSSLRFRLTATPRLQASVRLRGVRESIQLREREPGIYVGRYTVRREDRLRPGTDVTAQLRFGNRAVSAEFELGQALRGPVAANVPRPPDALRIDRFAMAPVQRLEPGADLQFSLEGMPGANVSVDLPGVERDLRLRESRPGHYEGSYTIRRSDDFNPNRPIVATLRAGERVVTANLPPLTGRPAGPNADNRAPNVGQLSPPEGATVPSGPPVVVSGSFRDGGGSGVEPGTVRVVVSGRNLTPDAQISADGFSLRTGLAPGRHTVEVTARDRAGNTVQRSWSFDVAAAAPGNSGVRIIQR